MTFIVKSVVKSGLLFGGCLCLVFRFPLRIRHPIDYLPRLFIIQVDSFILCRRPVPFTQAIATKPGQIHKINVLYLGVLTEMVD